ncbi:MAG: GntR family transcriptional regulator [Acidobacteria bacterium]|nr:GntR family transcriptional regulator [Acidobacteriota bacterium]
MTVPGRATVRRKRSGRRKAGSESLSASVYGRLRDAILSGEYRPGARLNEDEIARRFRVSRTPLRDALKQLELEGLVTRTRYQGVSVKRLSPDEILELLDLREVLEGLAARLAAEHMSDADREKLQAIFAEAEELNRTGEYASYLDRATQFHELLVDSSGSEQLSRFMRNMYDRIRLVRSRTIYLPGRARNSLNEHRELLAALVARDPDRAETVNRARIRAIKRDVLAALTHSLVW